MKSSRLAFWKGFLPFCMLILLSHDAAAEGTKQVAPNGSITINGTTTNDVAALHINNPLFNNFASYDNTDENSRLHIHIADPQNECIYLGFSLAHLNSSTPNPTPQVFEYRIKDPDGNIVFGPRMVDFSSPQISNWQEAVNGPAQLNAGGYAADFISSADLMSGSWTGAGDYYIEFDNLSGDEAILIDYWDITVVDCSGASSVVKEGRLWSKNWAIFAINDFGFPNRPFNGSFYVCAPDPADPESAFITRIDFNDSGFRPAAFNVAFNSFGTMNTGNIAADRRSIENANFTQPEYEIFLNDPIDICKTAQGGSIEISGISSCDALNFCIGIKSTKSGQVDLLLDFNGNDGEFTPGTEDVMITGNVIPDDVDKDICLDWDGLDGLGNNVSDNGITQVPIVISFAQGIYHFPIYDAELMTEGFEITAIRPTGDDPLLYYDDSNISVSSGSGEPAVQLSGCDLPCHRWTNYTMPNTVGFGNLNTINSWWFSQQLKTEETFSMPTILTTSIEGPDRLCDGEILSLIATNTFDPEENPDSLEIISRVWELEGSPYGVDTDTVFIVEGGLYSYTIEWLGINNDTCQAKAWKEVEELMGSSTTIDSTIVLGDSLVVNNESYNQEGTYTQVLIAANGCDSTITIIVEVEEPEYTCEIVGDPVICFGDTSILSIQTFLDPEDAAPPVIYRVEWSGPGITGQVETDSIFATRQGTYVCVLTWINARGVIQFTECSFVLDVNPRFAVTIDTLLVEGEVLDINGQIIDEPGNYEQIFTSQNGCDSLVFINVISQNAVVFYGFEGCKSSDYEKFTPEYPNGVLCGDLEASIVYRDNPESNLHSCTPGFEGGEAVCVSSVDVCEYDPGNELSIRFDLLVLPESDSAVHITSLSFLERAPEVYVWNVGNSGVNNYPLFYGLRVLKNGVEVFRQEDVETTHDWTREIYTFIDNPEFVVEVPSLFEFELLSYCLVGADSHVTAWDIDQLSIQASCGLPESNMSMVSGFVETVSGETFSQVDINLVDMDSDVTIKRTSTGGNGEFALPNVLNNNSYYVTASYDWDHLNGVSAIDLIAIQRHILGIDVFDNPHQYIAADIDNSQSITAADLLHLKRVILGVSNSFPNNESWRFYDSRQDVSRDAPFDIKERIDIYNLKANMLKQNMNGIKVGDVNMDNNIEASRRNNSSPHVYFKSNDQFMEANKLQELTFTAEGELFINALQMELAIQSMDIHNVSLLADGDEVDMDYSFIDNTLTILFADINHVINTESVELIMSVVPHQDIYLSSAVSITEANIPSRIFDVQDKAYELELMLGRDYDSGVLSVRTFPNPFVHTTQLFVDSKIEQSAILTLTGSDGRVIYRNELNLNRGVTEIDIDADNLSNMKGIIFCELLTQNHKSISKLIKY